VAGIFVFLKHQTKGQNMALNCSVEFLCVCCVLWFKWRCVA